MTESIESIPDICDVEIVSPDGASTQTPDYLFEIPHGATSHEHYLAIRQRLVGRLPDDLEAFYFVNTDVGAYECARQAAEMIAGRRSISLLDALLEHESSTRDAGPRPTAMIVRSLVPRTFVDCNRELAGGAGASGMTPAIPEYVTDPRDRSLLAELHDAYQTVAASSYRRVCGSGGRAWAWHTYAPREVGIAVLDHDIVNALRRAYRPETYASWRPRPDVDIICEATDGTRLAPPGLPETLAELYGRAGVRTTENDTYRLHPATFAHTHSLAYPGQVICFEINRALLADPFSPFEEMTIGEAKAARMAAPVAAACLRHFGKRVAGEKGL